MLKLLKYLTIFIMLRFFVKFSRFLIASNDMIDNSMVLLFVILIMFCLVEITDDYTNTLSYGKYGNRLISDLFIGGKNGLSLLPFIRSAAFSAIITTGALVLPEIWVGITDASTTLNPVTPFTLS